METKFTQQRINSKVEQHFGRKLTTIHVSEIGNTRYYSWSYVGSCNQVRNARNRMCDADYLGTIKVDLPAMLFGSREEILSDMRDTLDRMEVLSHRN